MKWDTCAYREELHSQDVQRTGGRGRERKHTYNDRFDVTRLVSWCFEPSQPQRITSGLTMSRGPERQQGHKVMGAVFACSEKQVTSSNKDKF